MALRSLAVRWRTVMESALHARSKLPDVGTTIFTGIGQLAAQHEALNLSQGAPNFAPDPALVDSVAAAMHAGHNQYAPMAGIGALREALADKVETLYGVRYDPATEVTVIASASEGLYSTISALVHPGDEVIYFEPSFDSYGPIVRLQGATPIAIKLSLTDFRVDWDEVDAAKHQSMACDSELAERSVIVSSFGKSYHVTGWRVGYCLAPAALMDEIRKVHQFMVFSADTPMQYAFVEALARPESYLGLSAFYQQKRDLLAHALRESRFELLPSEGSFFMLARFRGFSEESDSDFVLRLIRDAGVATIPLSAFYSDGTDHGVIRLSF